jgi:hypothetical protein
VALKTQFPAMEAVGGAGRHINADATLRTKCGAPHLVRETCTSGSVRDEDGNILIYSANLRGVDGNVGIIRNPLRAIDLLDQIILAQVLPDVFRGIEFWACRRQRHHRKIFAIVSLRVVCQPAWSKRISAGAPGATAPIDVLLHGLRCRHTPR